MKQYILLQPLNPYHLGMKLGELKQILRDSQCQWLISTDTRGHTVVYVTAKTPEILSEFVTDNDLDGIVVEYTGVYDQKVELV